MGNFYTKPLLFIIIVTVTKLSGFAIAALGGIFESTLVEKTLTANEVLNRKIASDFETCMDVIIFCGFADLSVGFFLWLV
jgi:hypothetical protein